MLLFADGLRGRAQTSGSGRRRGATLENALLDAAWEELHSKGYARLTMERVADRAGTSRAVIYRRWRNRPELVIAAMRHHQPVLTGLAPDTGSLRGDVLAVLRGAPRRISAIGPDTALGLLGDHQHDAQSTKSSTTSSCRSSSAGRDRHSSRRPAPLVPNRPSVPVDAK